MMGLDPVMSELLRIIGLWTMNLLGLAAADRLALSTRLPPEGARKLIHVTAGCLAIPLPWVLRSNVSMLVLAGGALVGLLTCRRLGLLKSIHAVERSSTGDLLFPVGIALLFLVGRSEPVLYLIGLSYMVLSDALAALVGRRYGRSSYSVELQSKSVEGSVTFFVVSFVAAHLILLLGTEMPRLTTVLVATQLAALVTCFEAISMNGDDNVLVPLVTCLVVSRLVDLPSTVLARDLFVQLGIGVLVALATVRWRFAGATGAVTLALFLYGAYALGGVLWIVAPTLVGITYVAMRAAHWNGEAPSGSNHQVVAVFYVTVVAAVLYLIGATAGLLGLGASAEHTTNLMLAPYLGTSAAGLALLVYTLWRPWDAPVEALEPGLVPAVFAAAVMAPLSVFAPSGAPSALLWIALTPLLALSIYRKVRRGSSWPRAVPWNSRLQAAAVATALVIVTPLHVSLFNG